MSTWFRGMRYGFPLAVFVVGVLATTALSWQLRRTIEAQDRERLAAAADQLQVSISSHVDTYAAILRAGAGLLAAHPDTGRQDFRAFVERLQLEVRSPGIQGVGFTRRVTDAQVAALNAAQRAAGDPDFRVWPPNARAEYHSILYLEPLDRRNRAAIGFDMFTEPTRRAAMERARDSGEPAASGVVTLVQEIDEVKQPGFLLYVPVYAGGVVPPTLQERRTRLLGFVYSPFRAGDLFAGIVGPGPLSRIGLSLYGGAPSPNRLLYRSAGEPPTGRFTTTRDIDIAGQRWTAVIFSTPGLDRGSSIRLVPLATLGGFGVTLLLTLLSGLQTRARRRAERSEAAAEDAARRFEQLANSIPQLAWMARPDGWIYWYNDRWYEYTGCTPEQMAGWGWEWVHDPNELPRVLEGWRASLQTGTPFEMEFPLRGHGGEFRWFLTRVTPFRGPNGAIVHWFGTNTDVQHRRDAEQSLSQLYRQVQTLLASERTARAEAERVSRLKDEFLATLSHELRTPLNAVMGWAHLLHEGSLPEAKRHDATEAIVRNALIQSRLVDDLLDMSRIVSGRVRVEMHVLDLRTVIDAAVDVVGPTADAKRLSLTTTLPECEVLARGDSTRLQQVVWNLLSNAIKFTPPQGRIEVGVTSVRDHVELWVSDTGAGIDPEFLPHVFDRFRQADASFTRRHGGLGLGLAIVRSLVEMHGGSVRAASDGSSRGSTFTVVLPACLEVIHTA